MSDPDDEQSAYGDERDTRDRLVDEFRQGLRSDAADRYYSEDDLIEIFDRAGDLGYDYVQAEVLILGARLYPDSMPLLERRLIFYREFVPDAFDAMLEDHPDISTPMWDLHRLLARKQSPDEVGPSLERFVIAHPLRYDELVIQFLAVARSLNACKWVFDNLDLLRSSVEYLPTLLYEVAGDAAAEGNFDLHIKLIEELSEIDPYCVDYWVLLARAYEVAARYDEAANALELALAIDPDNAEALKVKFAMWSRRYDLDEKIDIDEYCALLQRVSVLDTSDSAIVLDALQRLADLDPVYGRAVVDRLVTDHAVTMAMVVPILNIEYPDIDGVLDTIYRYGDFTTADQWCYLADQIYEEGLRQYIPSIFNAYQRNTGESLNHDFLMLKLVYETGAYDVAVQIFTNASPEGTIRDNANMFEAYGMFLMSLLRLGREAEVADGLPTLIKSIEKAHGGTQMSMAVIGLKAICEDIDRRLHSDTKTDWATYDPFKLDHSK